MIHPDHWQPADGLTLEPNALLAAKEQVECLAITAGPGAGKTESLAQRADFLLRTGLCRYPNRILAISFKVDASRNLKERVRRRCGNALAARFDSYTFHAFAKRIIDRFRPVLQGNDTLDVDYSIGEHRVFRRQITFNDLVPLAIQILRDSEVVRNAIRQTYCDVFLDEFQDCTNLQYALIKLAFDGTAIRLTAVGDTKQRIMGWAGALEGIFITFADDFRARPLNLYRNFRSQPQLLRMQNEIIKVLDPSSVMPDELIKGDGGVIGVQAFSNDQQEAEVLAEAIKRWSEDDGVPYSEIAVLVSKQADLYTRLLTGELTTRGVPFRNEQDIQDLSVEPATRLIVDYLLVLFGDREPDAYARLMAQLTSSSLDDREETEQHNNWHRFMQTERKKISTSNSPDGEFDHYWAYAIAFLKEFGKERLASLSADYHSSTRLNQVIDDTKERLRQLFEINHDMVESLERFTDDHAVRIMTIHKSKGLEFEIVVVLGVEKQAFWGKSEDERCAFFVGISRAKKRLVLTHASVRVKPPGFNRRWDVARSPHEEFIGYAIGLQRG